MDSSSEPTQPDEKEEEDFFTATLNADVSNSEENEDHFKVQPLQVISVVFWLNFGKEALMLMAVFITNHQICMICTYSSLFYAMRQ